MIKYLFFLSLMLLSCTTVYRVNCTFGDFLQWANIKTKILLPDSILNNPGDTIELTGKIFTKEELQTIKGTKIKGKLYDSLLFLALEVEGALMFWKYYDNDNGMRNKYNLYLCREKYEFFYLGEAVISGGFRSFLIMLTDENYSREKNGCKDFSRRVFLINAFGYKVVSYIELSNYSLINGNVKYFYTDFSCDTMVNIHREILCKERDWNSSMRKHIVVDSIAPVRVILKEDGLIDIIFRTVEWDVKWDYDGNEEYIIID